VWRGNDGALEGRVRASYGLADKDLDGAVSLRVALGGQWLTAETYRDVRDVADRPIVSPVMNSIAAQEFGDDYGDYARVSGGRVGVEGTLGGPTTWRLGVRRETPTSLTVHAAPMSGVYRPNPALGGPSVSAVTLSLSRAAAGLGVRHDHAFEVTLEAGRSDTDRRYARHACARARGRRSGERRPAVLPHVRPRRPWNSSGR
jgi:hypothetical protein